MSQIKDVSYILDPPCFASGYLIDLEEHPELWEGYITSLDNSLSLIHKDRHFGIIYLESPPLKIDDEYRSTHPEHPLCREDFRDRQKAGMEIAFWAYYIPHAFDIKRLAVLQACLFDCDASIRWDCLRAVGYLCRTDSLETLHQYASAEHESDSCRAAAQFLLLYIRCNSGKNADELRQKNMAIFNEWMNDLE